MMTEDERKQLQAYQAFRLEIEGLDEVGFFDSTASRHIQIALKNLYRRLSNGSTPSDALCSGATDSA